MCTADMRIISGLVAVAIIAWPIIAATGTGKAVVGGAAAIIALFINTEQVLGVEPLECNN